MKEAKDMLDPSEIKTLEIYIFTKEEWEFMWANILKAIGAVPS